LLIDFEPCFYIWKGKYEFFVFLGIIGFKFGLVFGIMKVRDCRIWLLIGFWLL
jgi:hypothetical protein